MAVVGFVVGSPVGCVVGSTVGCVLGSPFGSVVGSLVVGGGVVVVLSASSGKARMKTTVGTVMTTVANKR